MLDQNSNQMWKNFTPSDGGPHMSKHIQGTHIQIYIQAHMVIYIHTHSHMHKHTHTHKPTPTQSAPKTKIPHTPVCIHTTDLSLHALNGVNDDSDSPLGQRLEALLCVDVHSRQPAAKTRVRVIPAHHHLWPDERDVLGVYFVCDTRRERDTHTQVGRETETQRQRERDTEREGGRQWYLDKLTDWQRERERGGARVVLYIKLK